MKLLILFIVLNIVNVILQTFKSIATVKCGKLSASIINAVAYGLYTVVLVYTNCELNLWAKVAVVAVTNLIGVYIVKLIEEKLRKDKLWKIEFTVKNNGNGDLVKTINNLLEEKEVSHYYSNIDEKYTIFNCYCATQAESLIVKQIVEQFKAKYFANETKIL